MRPDEVLDLGAVHDKLTPEQFARVRELSNRIETTHAEISRMPRIAKKSCCAMHRAASIVA